MTTPNNRRSASNDWQHRAAELGERLPSGFVVGTATAAFQIEGGAREGGRGESVWDWFTAQPGRIVDGSNASVAADHYHRYAEDIALARDLGSDAYRFSFAWPRLQPDGRGALNRNGVGFYDRLLDELLAAGIRPMATLFHWDTPLALRGGWLNRDTAQRFGDFAFLMGEAFGDRIDAWVTINEPATVTLNGYALGIHAPGEPQLWGALPSAHHQLLGHGLAVQALRAADVRGQIGITNVHSPVQPASDREMDAVVAGLFDVLHNRIFADPVLLGRYPVLDEPFDSVLRALAEVDPDDLVTIHQPLDFYGVNYYLPSRVAAGSGDASSPDGRAEALTRLPFHLEPFGEHPVTGFGWPIAPEYLSATLTELRDRYGDALPPVFITEGGASFADVVDEYGEVDDLARIDYLAGHIVAAVDAVSAGGVADGVDLRGYFVWSLLDNFEWAAGYTQRFGLVHVDFQTQKRTPKQSYRWLQRVLAARS
ncbi:GH1 family beta-glucosidase [Glaciibacter superstes]|uniref:GH1 family beta-glucosidase n=1 Tax=Glaciibacter superstes TaxID=501023 RepID=UPI0003B4960D|nr:GH1 family beta-glucosidase [Glaciibacter superstes]